MCKHIISSSFLFLEQTNPNGQALLASTIVPHPNQGTATHGASSDMPFGRLVYGPSVAFSTMGALSFGSNYVVIYC
jgi:hypothetical protein